MLDRLRVFKRWGWRQYAAFLGLKVLILFLVIELRNWSLLVWFHDISGSLLDTGVFALTMMGGLFTLFTPLGTAIVVSFALLVSINTVLLFEYIRAVQVRPGLASPPVRATAVSLSGLVAGILGIGCASCGAAVLFGLLSIVGASALIVALPLGGQEFGIAGVALLVYSAWYLLGKLRRPKVCTR